MPKEEESVGETPTEEIPVETVSITTAAVSETSTEAAPESSTHALEETYQLDYYYLISTYCFDYVNRSKTHPKEKKDFVSFFEESCKGEEVILSHIREFQMNYLDNQAISWFVREPIFSICINYSFKCATVEAIHSCGMLIRDLEKQLIKNQCTVPIQVYQGEIMSDERFEKLQSFNGKIITIKSFFTANLDHDKAVSCSATSDSIDGFKRILFIIDANPESNKSKSFAKMTSAEKNDDEYVLFSIGSLFRMTGIEDERDSMIIVKLTFCANDETNPMQQTCDTLLRQYTNGQGETDRIRYGEFLVDFGRILDNNELFLAGERITRLCLDKFTSDDPETDRPHCYDALGKIESQKNAFAESLGWYKKALESRKGKVSSENDPSLITNYENLATVTFRQGDYPQAREYYQHLVKICKQSYGDDCLQLFPYYSSLAQICEKEENPKETLVYYYLILAIMTKHNYSDETSYASLYYNLGHTYTALKEYKLALAYYSRSLELKLKHFPNTSSTVAATYRSIGYLYKATGDVQQAQANLETAADIYRKWDPPATEIVAEIEEAIRNPLNPTPN